MLFFHVSWGQDENSLTVPFEVVLDGHSCALLPVLDAELVSGLGLRSWFCWLPPKLMGAGGLQHEALQVLSGQYFAGDSRNPILSLVLRGSSKTKPAEEWLSGEQRGTARWACLVAMLAPVSPAASSHRKPLRGGVILQTKESGCYSSCLQT